MRLSKTRRGRLGRGIVLVAAVGLHALVLLLLARPAPLSFPDYSNDEDTVDVSLERPRRPSRSTARAEVDSPAPRAPAIIAPAAVEALPLEPLAARPTTASGPAASSPRGDLGAALRSGGYACGSGRALLLTPEERARCEEKLGALALKAPPLPAPIDPDKRAYYDAVAEAYRDPGQMVPLTARGAGGMFAAERSVHLGHGPRVGCSVKFGPNARKAPKGPANALRAGPCFIQPPNGSLSPEADIRKPY
uniref:Uncharacterized protein n=1 Tax=Caulobacter sp. (strain K31) TaxID=366602 RepID=B0SUQ3_CAUSK